MNVKLLGFKENPSLYIKKSDLFCCYLVKEEFLLVIAQAMV